MTPPKKRPKVRYVVEYGDLNGSLVRMVINKTTRDILCDCEMRGSAERIAAALNWHTAFKMGEL